MTSSDTQIFYSYIFATRPQFLWLKYWRFTSTGFIDIIIIIIRNENPRVGLLSYFSWAD